LTVARVIEALGLPAGARVDQRVPKKLLVENGAPTAADKKQINDGIESLTWIAALKPTTVGIPDYRDEAREYLEVAILSLQLRPTGKLGRLTELVHRAVPYPVLLLTEGEPGPTVSMSHKRWSQGEGGKTVLDGEITSVRIDVEDSIGKPFLNALALLRQPKASLYALYQAWIDAAIALQAASLTGAFVPAANSEEASARAEALTATKQLEAQIASIQVAAKKEKQISKQVQMNLKVRELRAELSAAKERL
jgi:hypothetical protein